MKMRIRTKQLAMAALAFAVIAIPLSASAGLLYNPVVTVDRGRSCRPERDIRPCLRLCV